MGRRANSNYICHYSSAPDRRAQQVSPIPIHYLMRLSKYYQQATLYPFQITVVITSIFAVMENRNYKSEWLTAESVIMMAIVGAILYCIFLNVLCLTIFLCKLEVVQNNRLLTVLSWFLLPLSPSVVTVLREFNYDPDIRSAVSDGVLYVVFLNGPYIIGLVWAFVRYRKAMQIS